MEDIRVLSAEDFQKKKRFRSKTKSGCDSCKVKKVKCDERKPRCLRCQRNSRTCRYPGPNGSHQGFVLPTRTCGPLIPFALPPGAKNGTPSLHLLQHCQASWPQVFSMVYTDELFSYFKTSPLVRHIVLAMGASHLRHVASGDVRQHRIAEHFHVDLALRAYRDFLRTPPEELGLDGVNTLLVGATLLAVLATPIPASAAEGTVAVVSCEGEGQGAWVRDFRDQRFEWMTLQAGIRPVLLAMNLFYRQAMDFMRPLFLGDGPVSIPPMSRTLEGVPSTWVEFFGLGEEDEGQDSTATDEAALMSKQKKGITSPSSRKTVFRSLAKLLSHLKGIPPLQGNIFFHMVFLGKADLTFRLLVNGLDERALWLYAYWFGLLRRFDLWWARERAAREYGGVVQWLYWVGVTERPGEEGRLWREMMVELETAPFL